MLGNSPAAAREHRITFAPTPGSEIGQQGILIKGCPMRPYDPPEEMCDMEPHRLAGDAETLLFTEHPA